MAKARHDAGQDHGPAAARHHADDDDAELEHAGEVDVEIAAGVVQRSPDLAGNFQGFTPHFWRRYGSIACRLRAVLQGAT